MNKIFGIDSPLMIFLSRLCDLMILNLLFLVCSIPIFTIGDTLTALYYVSIKIAIGEEGYIAKGFFKSFKQNFKQATIIWMAFLVVFAVLLGDLMIMFQMKMPVFKVLAVLILILAFICLLTLTFLFPILSRFDNTIKITLKNSLIMSVLYLPRTLAMLILMILPAFIAYFYPIVMPLYILFGFSAPVFINAKIVKGALKKMEDTQSQEQ